MVYVIIYHITKIVKITDKYSLKLQKIEIIFYIIYIIFKIIFVICATLPINILTFFTHCRMILSPYQSIFIIADKKAYATIEKTRRSVMIVLIRPEETRDISQIYKLNEAAFGRLAEAELVDALRKSDANIEGLSIVAEVNGYIHGHILFSKVDIVREDKSVISVASLAPMAVLPESQNMGIGSKLVRYGLETCELMGYPLVVVLGHTRFYPRFGFMPAVAWGINCPYGNESFMVYSRDTGLLQSAAGTVKYPKPFSLLN